MTLYADDLILLGRPIHMPQLLDILNTQYKNLHLAINDAKTEVIGEPVEGLQITPKTHVIYLGYPICARGLQMSKKIKHLSSNIAYRIAPLHKAGLFWKSIHLHPASRLFKSFISSLATYFLPFMSTAQCTTVENAICRAAAKYWGFNSSPNHSVIKDSLNLIPLQYSRILSQRSRCARMETHSNPLIQAIPPQPPPPHPGDIPKHTSKFITLASHSTCSLKKQQVATWCNRLPHMFRACLICDNGTKITPNHLLQHDNTLHLSSPVHSAEEIERIVRGIEALAMRD